MAGYEKTSDPTNYPPTPGAYNCIAWAAHDTHHFMWPEANADWPFWSPLVNDREAFLTAFHGFGYRVCDNSHVERWFEKVALYELNGEPKHMARQLRDGTWTSKCGGAEDITHFTLDALESHGPHPLKAEYGRPEVYLRRLVLISWMVRMLQWSTWKVEVLIPYLGYWIWKRR